MKLPSFNLKKFLLVTAFLLLFSQILLVIAAYQLTHFKQPESSPEERSIFNSLLLLNRPMNTTLPSPGDKVIQLTGGDEKIEIWYHPVDSAKGIVVLFHGYKGEKTSLNENAAAFRALGYSTILTDFRGSGNSEGRSTTIGYREAENVVSVYEYALQQNNHVILYGVSMGAASIMRAVAINDIQPEKIILECPFSTMKQTIRNRFVRFHVPVYPFADQMTFWGGKLHGFDAFSHNPVDYAKDTHVPVLLMCGNQDRNVKNFETDSIFASLASQSKSLHIFKGADHENYIFRYGEEWLNTINNFLEEML